VDIIITSPYFLAFLFFIVAFVYSSVGLGGASSYTALMAIFGISSLAIPMVSLSLNLLVTSVGSFNFIRNKHAKIKLILPFLISSIPMAYLGGSLQIPKEIFYWVLLISLIFVAVRIYLWQNTTINFKFDKREKIILSLFAGSVLGLIAGIVGIGGGVYLVPLIIILGLGTEKEAIPLIIAVVAGGALGSHLGASRFSSKVMEKMLGLVIIVAIIFLTKKLLSI